MKHILRKLHIGGSHESFDGRTHDVDGRVLDGRTHVVGRLNSPDAVAQSEATSSSGFSGWFRHNLLPSTNAQSSSRTRLDTAGGAAESAASPRPGSDQGAGSPADFKYYEEEYQLQLALALSVSNQNDLDDPESLQIRAAKRISLGRPASPGNTIGDFTAHRYWNYNVLDYEERVVDGFYDVYGVVSDFGNSEKMPSLVDLQGTSVTDMLGYEVVLVNRAIDPDLVQLEQAALCLAVNSGVGESGPQRSGLVQKIADLVVEHMGGPVVDANDMLRRWRTGSYELRTSLNNIVLPLGCLRIGLSRHRALLFKVLADHVGIPCRLVKGSHYTGTDEGAVNIVKVDNDREYIVDLMGAPGTLLPAEMVGASLHLDFLDSTASEEELFSQISQSHITSGNLIKDKNTRDELNGRRPLVKSEGNVSDAHQDWARFDDNAGKRPAGDKGRHLHLGQRRQSSSPQEAGFPVSPTRIKDVSQSVMDTTQKNPQLVEKLHATFMESGGVSQQDLVTGLSSQQSHVSDACNSPAVRDNAHDLSVQAPSASAALQISSEGSSAANLGISKSNEDEMNSRFGKSSQGYKVGGENECKPRRHKAHEKLSAGNQCYLDRWTEHVHNKGDSVLEDVGEWEIPWEEIVIGERIGLGSYGEVHHGDWHGKEVAVKKFLDQDFSGDALDEFISEVRIMRRMEHPNVVLFMGAVTRPPNLSIVTEYLPRGSLFRLLHRPNCQLDEGRRLKMALDVAKGMNYLHTSKPIIVHRDLKSPNLLVDKDWVAKVCDFGLSRMKHHTFLSSKSTAGTPEWMAPEVLRNEPSNEKCDVYSFGVILWELATLQQPWSGINPMQVVGAVGFQNRRLEIPNDVEPSVARIIWECWQSDPGLRPSFSELMISLEPLGRLIKD